MEGEAGPQNSKRRRWGMDARFFDLMRWEARQLRGRRQVGPIVVLALLTLGIVVTAWRVAELPERSDSLILILRATLDAATLSTPIRDEMPRLSQLTFGYALLRYALYGLILCARLIVPAVVASSVAGDRKSGRMEEMKMMPVAAWMAYLARALAPALPFIVLILMLPVALAGPLIGEVVPSAEVARLMLEAIGQVLMAALVALTCSMYGRSPWGARALVDYLLLWLAFPLLWAMVLRTMGVAEFADTLNPGSRAAPPYYAGFGVLCFAQAALTGAVCLAAFVVGVRRYRSIGAS